MNAKKLKILWFLVFCGFFAPKSERAWTRQPGVAIRRVTERTCAELCRSSRSETTKAKTGIGVTENIKVAEEKR